MEQLTTTVDSKALSLADIIQSNYRFSIPRYQRLYVWEDEQVSTLIADLLTAAKVEPTRAEAASQLLDTPYFLGGILLVPNQQRLGVFDLIDGQQRLTTLWLMSVALGEPMVDFTICDSNPRLSFAIREAANSYFRAKCNLTPESLSDELVDNSLERLTRAYRRVDSLLQQAFDQQQNPTAAKETFCQFLRNQVYLVVTEVPPFYDLNRLFESTNNRGAQLRHHEILKSRILSHIADKAVRRHYARVWDACANMDGYVERNLNQELRQNTARFYDKDRRTFDLKKLLERLDLSGQSGKEATLSQILAGETQPLKSADVLADLVTEHTDSSGDEPVRSILSFPQLLLHTLRISLYQRDLPDLPRINEKELLQLFAEGGAIIDAPAATAFIDLLWQTRFCFDLFVIKWGQTDDEQRHVIKALTCEQGQGENTYYFRRGSADGGSCLELLQSMLYHSQQITTHYWLTPFLYRALTCRDRDQLTAYLQKLDNQLFCTEASATLAERTRSLMGVDLTQQQQLSCSCDVLDERLGVSFPHYWFYKLDFVLWCKLASRKMDDRWKLFRFTAKNSVEHVSPQNPRQDKQKKLSSLLLDDFGNLALVSRGINSEASNKSFSVKKAEFAVKYKLDSLKSALIYENLEWNDNLCLAHGGEMKRYLKDYFLEHNGVAQLDLLSN